VGEAVVFVHWERVHIGAKCDPATGPVHVEVRDDAGLADAFTNQQAHALEFFCHQGRGAYGIEADFGLLVDLALKIDHPLVDSLEFRHLFAPLGDSLRDRGGPDRAGPPGFLDDLRRPARNRQQKYGGGVPHGALFLRG